MTAPFSPPSHDLRTLRYARELEVPQHAAGDQIHGGISGLFGGIDPEADPVRHAEGFHTGDEDVRFPPGGQLFLVIEGGLDSGKQPPAGPTSQMSR